ncbi:MAG: hypothetical protein AAGI13_13230 [Pseudomonadota bacterium]
MRWIAPISMLVTLLTVWPSFALEPITPREFRDYAEGYTLYFERDGEAFGSESFEPGGSTTWRYRDGICVDGVWKAHGAQICFYYGNAQAVLCWRMLRDGDRLLARLLGDGENAGMELEITRRDRAPLICGEPGEAL